MAPYTNQIGLLDREIGGAKKCTVPNAALRLVRLQPSAIIVDLFLKLGSKKFGSIDT